MYGERLMSFDTIRSLLASEITRTVLGTTRRKIAIKHPAYQAWLACTASSLYELLILTSSWEPMSISRTTAAMLAEPHPCLAPKIATEA